MTNPINIVSYNVLSSHLGGADYFTSCLPEYLVPRYRLTKLQEQLETHISNHAIICLQEVSSLWLGHLHSFFLNHDYYLISGMYGHRMNGYMGVCIAVPMNEYAIIDADIKTISDTKRYPPKKAVVAHTSILSKFFAYLSSIMEYIIKAGTGIKLLLGLGSKPPENAWSIAMSRFNQMVSVRLQSKVNKSQRFVVGNYHMPCIFDKPQVMMIHTSLSAQYLQKRAKDDPFIYCGDFNSKPDSSMYRLLTQATVDDQDPAKPEKHFPDDDWDAANLVPMRSAYSVAQGKEPEFTNFSKVRDQDVFMDTLDYIFISHHWRVLSVTELISRTAIIAATSGRPLPDKDYPSDHLLIAAELSL